MKRYGFTTKSVTNYEDDQIVIPVADAKCLNVAYLVEHASMSLFKPLDETYAEGVLENIMENIKKEELCEL